MSLGYCLQLGALGRWFKSARMKGLGCVKSINAYDSSRRSWIYGFQEWADGQVLVEQRPMDSVTGGRHLRATSLDPTRAGQRRGALLPRDTIGAAAGCDCERVWCRRDPQDIRH